MTATVLCAVAPRSARAQTRSATDVADLPLREILASPPSPPSHARDTVFAVFITGDGGWASIDNQVTSELAARGVNVVGLDSRAYLHVARTPERVADDVSRIVRHYQRAWGTRRFALVGYSRGADLAPFIVARFDSTLRADLALVGMLGLGQRAGFEFHFQDIFRDVKRPTDRPTLPELARLGGVRMVCIYGAEEKESGCRSAPEGSMQKIQRPGSHHFDSDYKLLADLILESLHR
ncbi:MAG TPA: AcvB/VirJ family lysyl-phosphatidylglycerol hydrolase [Gemmatimonadaceae bacterium]|nr:AcvB/VirJ family lysyl-phosphatidylglycerol hydrolase [Gemmatimonadaceae bacterium]